MTFIDAFLNVLAIIGIIVAGGFLVFFLGDLLLSILEPRRKEQKEEEKAEENSEEEQSFENTQTFTMEEEATITEQKFTLDDETQAVDYDAAQKEKESLGIVEEVQEEEEDFNALFNEGRDFDFNDNFDFDKIFEEEAQVEEETTEKIAESDILPILPAAVAATVAAESNADYEEELKKQIESLKNELEEQKALYESLKEQSKNNEEKWEIEKADLAKLYKEAEEVMEEKPLANLTLEEYETRLEVLRTRLKVNEKELKANKKEFIPLRRVRKNLDKDKEKLRRREALVAKQKVMLYGVNNITDIDQEKAQKLAEDLDLLDGLKVSVRHCEEVMEANKDRYPILETANRILVTQNNEIKADIAECEAAIASLKNGNTEEDGATPIAVVKNEEANAEELIANANEAINAETEKEEVLVAVATEEEKPKRKRGRPRKDANAQAVVAEEPKVEQTSFEDIQEVQENIQEETFEPFESHMFDFDADEPSFEDLFAIEQEEKNRKDEDLF